MVRRLGGRWGVCCAAVVVLWAAWFLLGGPLLYVSDGKRYLVELRYDGVAWDWGQESGFVLPRYFRGVRLRSAPGVLGRRGGLTLDYFKVRSWQVGQQEGVFLPSWPAVAVVLVVWAALVRRHWRAPTAPGACATCGYNLTGNVSGRCPECGTPVPSSDVEKGDRCVPPGS